MPKMHDVRCLYDSIYMICNGNEKMVAQRRKSYHKNETERWLNTLNINTIAPMNALYIRIGNLSKVDIPKYFNILVSKFMKMKIDCIKSVFVVWLSGS